jgi:acyl transferase domain-containing protein
MLCLADFAYTMQTGRKALKERQIFKVGNTDELITQMTAFSNQG